MDNQADLGSQSSCLCKAGLSHHPPIALSAEDLWMAPGQHRQPSAIPTCPPSHHARAHQPGIRGSKNDTKPPLPHLNMTYAKSSLAGAEDQGPETLLYLMLQVGISLHPPPHHPLFIFQVPQVLERTAAPLSNTPYKYGQATKILSLWKRCVKSSQ